jgi:Isoleucyl-tRNA synthetase
VFTTEPWTITACKGLAVHPMVNYSLIHTKNGESYLIATQRYEKHRSFFDKLGGKKMMSMQGDQFGDFTVVDPLTNRNLRVVFDNEIRPKYGSGINPVCPAHFIDDLKLAQVIFPLNSVLSLQTYRLEREGYVDEKGCFTEEVGEDLKGKNVLRDASNAVKKK